LAYLFETQLTTCITQHMANNYVFIFTRQVLYLIKVQQQVYNTNPITVNKQLWSFEKQIHLKTSIKLIFKEYWKSGDIFNWSTKVPYTNGISHKHVLSTVLLNMKICNDLQIFAWICPWTLFLGFNHWNSLNKVLKYMY
jgi:hypothetical protein